jgi:hypothetical protein
MFFMLALFLEINSSVLVSYSKKWEFIHVEGFCNPSAWSLRIGNAQNRQ